MKHYIKIAFGVTAILAGCASETATPTSEKIYHTQTSSQASIPNGLAVLMDRSARIEGRELIWSCGYRTAEGRVLIEQSQECEPVK
jgi:hypothetical protein